MLDTSEIDLVAKARKGDRHAYGELVRLHHQDVIGVVYRMCGNVHLAEDAAQEAFVRAWQKLPDYEHRSAFRNWVFRIAVNIALDALRREKVTSELTEVTAVSVDPQPEEQVMREETGAAVRRAVLDLPESSRMVLVLREYQGFSYLEIAEALDIPLGTVMSRLNYARNRLRALLEPYLRQTEEAFYG